MTLIVVGAIASAIQIATSVLYATLGEIVGQRAGIVNLGIEGVMLMGASVGYSVAATTGNAFAGLLAGAAAGCALNLLFAVLVVGRGTNQLASGLALFFFGGGVSTLIGVSFVGRQIKGLGALSAPGLSNLPHPYDRLFSQDVLVWAVVPIAAAISFILFRTRWGLHVRSVGEDRDAAYSSGLRPARLQFQALALAGTLSGIGGAHLSLAFTKTWQEGMTAGRGFIAIVIVIFALWRPMRAIAGALLFGAAMSIGLQIQAQGLHISPFLLDMLPYVVTIAVVLAWGRPKAFAVPAGLRTVFQGTAK